MGTLAASRALRGAALPRRGKGRRLSPGAAVAVPAAPSTDYDGLAAWLEGEGFRTVFSYRGPSPVDRARALEDAFADPEVGAVLFAERSRSATEYVRHLDYELLAENPKPFAGSDLATAMHAALGRGADLVTFWAPPAHELGAADSATRRALLRALTGFDAGRSGESGELAAVPIVSGIAEGELVGGDVSELSLLMGTLWEIDTRGKIVLLVAPRRAPWHVGRHLLHLANAGKLQEAAGICLAGLGDGGAAVEIAEAMVKPLGIPAVRGLPVGNGSRLATVPLGARVRLDAYDGRLELLEPGVR